MFSMKVIAPVINGWLMNKRETTAKGLSWRANWQRETEGAYLYRASGHPQWRGDVSGRNGCRPGHIHPGPAIWRALVAFG